jgi:hypothetical protein
MMVVGFTVEHRKPSVTGLSSAARLLMLDFVWFSKWFPSASTRWRRIPSAKRWSSETTAQTILPLWVNWPPCTV